jgi:glycosyltransferase involved in cell wall biosynthesis
VSQPSQKKVVIVHDWLVGGGAERVVLELHRMFPEAPIYTSYSTDEWQKRLDNQVVTGYLQHWPFSRLRKFLPLLRQWWFKHLDLSSFDLVISSSGNGEAKFVRAPAGAKHICYCHSPTHFYWRHYETYTKNPGFGAFNWLARLGLKLLVNPLRKADYKAAQKVDQFIANSTHIQSDIKKYYGRDSVVIYPPVDIERFNSQPPVKRHGFVTVGRQVPHKHTDIIVAACTQLGLPLKVIGSGPEHKKLVSIAGPTIEFLANASDEDVAREMASAQAFIFAAFEDFGITPVEAMAAGTPVIAYKAGGAMDYVETDAGLFFDEQTTDSLVAVLQVFPSHKFKSEFIKPLVQKFSTQNFHNQIKSLI